VLVVVLFNLAHFSQGWVQWGYRFSLDFIPFLLPLVALGAGRVGDGPATGDGDRAAVCRRADQPVGRRLGPAAWLVAALAGPTRRSSSPGERSWSPSSSYRATMLPGIGIWDTAEVQTVPPLLGTMPPDRLPAFVVLGWLANIPLAPFASRRSG
jgi:hypothetical protein